MTTTLADTVAGWDGDGAQSVCGDLFNQIHARIEFLHGSHYSQYVPTLGSDHGDFESRLIDWINNVSSDTEKQTLFELLPRITFFTREDFAALHQAAVAGPVTCWIIDELNLMLDDPNLTARVSTEIHEHTWFCGISDSMPISDFHHTNGLGGIDFRPDWRSLTKFGDRDRITNFMQNRRDANGQPRPLRRIVLLEDFVGSGTQISTRIRSENGSGYNAIEFAASLSPTIKVLVIALITCPDGHQLLSTMAARYPNLSYAAIIALDGSELVGNHSNPESGSLAAKTKALALSTYPKVRGNDAASPRPYAALGLGDTGALIVLYSNTPANTLPIIQHGSNSWHPIFPRSARIK